MAIYKNKDLEVDISFGTSKQINKSASFYTGDKGSTSIRITVKHKGFLFNFAKSDMVPTLDLIHSDGSIWLSEPMTIVVDDKGVVEYDIPNNIIAHAGTISAKLFLKNADTSIHALNFNIEILDSEIEGAVEKEISLVLVEDVVRNIMTENALGLVDDTFKTEVLDEFQAYTIANPELFKGEKGDQGEQGVRGPIGQTGAQGLNGAKGDKGDKGDEGPRGPQGVQGEKGDKGEQGIPGVDGQDADMTVIGSVQSDLVETNSLLDKVYKPLTSSVYLYVRPDGNDYTGDGSTEYPFATIQKAVSVIPKLIEKDHFIEVAEGTYDENVVIKGISGAAIWISREGGTVDPSVVRPNVKVKSITYYDCNAYCRVNSVEQLDAGALTGQGFIRFSRCSYGTVNSCLMDDGNITIPTLVWDRSGGGFNSCHFDNQRQCANSMNGSAIRCDATNTHGSIKSDIGVVVQAGEVFYNGNITWIEGATRPESYIQGGMINKYAVEIDLTTINGWNSYSTDYRPRALRMPDGTVHLYGLLKDGTPGSGSVAFTLPKGYIPKVKGIYGGFVSNGTIGKILIDTSGNFAVESMTGQYISLSGISFYAGF